VPETFVAESDERVALFSTATGRRLRYLTQATEYGDSAPAFSDDRSRVRFTRRLSDCSAALLEVRPDGTGLRTLVAREEEGPMPYLPVSTVRGLAYAEYDCAEGWGRLVLLAPDGSRHTVAEANSMTEPAVSRDGRYVYVQMSRWNASLAAEDLVMRQLRRIDVTGRTPDVVVSPPKGCEWEGGVVTRYAYRGRPSVVAAQRCGTGRAAKASLTVLDESLRGARRLLSLDGLRVLRVGIDPTGRHLLLYRMAGSQGDRDPDLVQRWSGGGLVTIARDVRAPDW
jgi:hypothetical protein